MRIDSQFWANLVDLDKHVDALIAKVKDAVEPSQPITREVPYFASVEVLFQNLPISLATAPNANSDALAGNNVKRVPLINNSSRIYIREVGFVSYYVEPGSTPTFGRVPNNAVLFPFNFRWNIHTSIKDRWYSDQRCLAISGGQTLLAGNHLKFKDPLVVEPQETLTFECELISFAGKAAADSNAVVSMILAGYREGI